MSLLFYGLSLLFVLGVSYLLSIDKKSLNIKTLGTLIVLQLLTAVLMLKTSVGGAVIESISNAVNKVIMYGNEGIKFVFGGLSEQGIFIINVLVLIIFTSTLLSILTYLKILPYLIKVVGGALSRITGINRVATFNAVNSIFFGQSEAVLAVKEFVKRADRKLLFTLTTTAMASVSASIMGAYMGMIPPKYVLVAMVLNALSALVVTYIVSPTKDDGESVRLDDIPRQKSLFDAISQGALDGGKVALIVAAMLVAYISLMSMIDAAFTATLSISFTNIVGYIFSPAAVLMGVPIDEALTVGKLMGVKMVTNEFVAMLQLKDVLSTLSEKSVAIISTFLVSFANFSSIGIIAGSVKAVSDEKATDVSKFGLKMLLTATLVSVLTAATVGLFI